jgi:hypothetical protein
VVVQRAEVPKPKESEAVPSKEQVADWELILAYNEGDGSPVVYEDDSWIKE